MAEGVRPNVGFAGRESVGRRQAERLPYNPETAWRADGEQTNAQHATRNVQRSTVGGGGWGGRRAWKTGANTNTPCNSGIRRPPREGTWPTTDRGRRSAVATGETAVGRMAGAAGLRPGILRGRVSKTRLRRRTRASGPTIRRRRRGGGGPTPVSPPWEGMAGRGDGVRGGESVAGVGVGGWGLDQG